jgi:hypothetical protein
VLQDFQGHCNGFQEVKGLECGHKLNSTTSLEG